MTAKTTTAAKAKAKAKAPAPEAPAQTALSAIEQRRARVAELTGQGLDRAAIAAELGGVSIYVVRNDQAALGVAANRAGHGKRAQVEQAARRGLDAAGIAAECGLSVAGTKFHLRKLGITVPRADAARRDQQAARRAQVQAMLDDGRSVAEVATALNLTRAGAAYHVRAIRRQAAA